MDEEQVGVRKEKANKLKELGLNPFRNDFKPDSLAADILKKHEDDDNEVLEKLEDTYALAGRVMAVNAFGKAAFIRIQDRSARIQCYIRKDQISEIEFQAYKLLDLGDIVGVRGKVMKTKTGELTVMVQEFSLLTKAIRPMPVVKSKDDQVFDAFSDVEQRYRQRYLDLIVTPKSRDAFYLRSKMIREIRNFLDQKDFMEVETPMMQPMAGGAAARPFKTHHNTLDMDLYLRIAPELYLKRLVVGGFERVYELNRNFRNEGISTYHNPEFTMLEFYQAYADYHDLMDLVEELICTVAKRCDVGREVNGARVIDFADKEVSLQRPFKRISMQDAIREIGEISEDVMNDRQAATEVAKRLGVYDKDMTHGKLIAAIFDEVVEGKLINPTFVTDFPLEISPLSRKKESDPNLVDRFEMFVVGRELSNAFSELNDPEDQRERFEKQVEEKQAGDEEAHGMDHDYVRALEHGMPPTGGCGIGIDRLAMLFADCQSIRDVILFPHMRPEH